MSQQEYTTNFIWDTVCNEETLYNAMHDKMRRRFFKKHTAVFTPVFADIVYDAKHIAQSLDTDVDLRFYAPKRMQVHLMNEYSEFLNFQKYMAEKIEALPLSGCFFTIIEFLKQRHTMKLYSQLVDELLNAISFVDYLLTENYSVEIKASLSTVRSHLTEWLRFTQRKV